MPLWIKWLTDNWLPVMLLAGIVVAVILVALNRKTLFYKE